MTFLQGEFKYFRRLSLFLQDNRLLILQLLIVKIENANNTTETPTHREQRQTKSIFGLFGYWRHSTRLVTMQMGRGGILRRNTRKIFSLTFKSLRVLSLPPQIDIHAIKIPLLLI